MNHARQHGTIAAVDSTHGSRGSSLLTQLCLVPLVSIALLRGSPPRERTVVRRLCLAGQRGPWRATPAHYANEGQRLRSGLGLDLVSPRVPQAPLAQQRARREAGHRHRPVLGRLDTRHTPRGALSAATARLHRPSAPVPSAHGAGWLTARRRCGGVGRLLPSRAP